MPTTLSAGSAYLVTFLYKFSGIIKLSAPGFLVGKLMFAKHTAEVIDYCSHCLIVVVLVYL